ncbi:MAG: hypothetical protein AAF763_15310 [Pseudomonadota bacterium]
MSQVVKDIRWRAAESRYAIFAVRFGPHPAVKVSQTLSNPR